MAFMIAFSATITDHFLSGPFFSTFSTENCRYKIREICAWNQMRDIFLRESVYECIFLVDFRYRENWWTNILYINIYVNPEAQCIGHTWYLASDMQMFLFSPFVFLPMYHLRGDNNWGLKAGLTDRRIQMFWCTD
jgi:peptidoglycan/LPS O-acetylase OafA/YrhL